MRFLGLLLVVATAGAIVVHGQSRFDTNAGVYLKRLFPAAASFSAKENMPVPHFKAFASGADGPQTVVGYGFYTTDLVPSERGYDGPIRIMVGIDLRGILTGLVVVEHHEPYGSFSVDPPSFAAQFKNKDILDPFRVGKDIDAVSRATITVSSAARAVRNSSRRLANAFQIGGAFDGVLTPATPPAR
jgi:NosR/NirI family transcriptional regulator, nitrous oxide reductase regulator